jgi:hypothetical protein
MRYQELTELFNNKVDWKWEYTDNEEYQGTFDVGDNRYELTVSLYRPGTWELAFAADGDVQVTGDFNKEGDGGALRVFATVAEMTLAFMKKEMPKILSFSASKSNSTRVTLYRRMAKKLGSNLSYNVRERDDGDELWFFLLNPEKQNQE